MSNFLTDLYENTLKPKLQTSKKAIRSFSALPEKCKSLERECTALRGIVSELESTLSSNNDEIELLNKLISESENETALVKARASLVNTLYRVVTLKTAEANREEIDGLMAQLVSQDKTIELLENLHDRLLSESEEQKKLLETEQSTSTEIKQELEQKEDSLARLDAEHKKLISEIRDSTSQTIEKLIDKGMSPTSITSLVPNIGNLYPRDEIIRLERQIREHHQEQEALLGLEKLNPQRQPAADEKSSANGKKKRTSTSPELIEWKIEPRSFFERIFSE